MIKCTLIYLEQNDQYLMLHRIKKARDVNKDKWIGVGGKFEPGETPEQCACREMTEETGLIPLKLRYRGIVYFENSLCESEEMHLFTCTEFKGKVKDCDEGELVWIKKKEIYQLNLWEGDRIFLEKLSTDSPFFQLRLIYCGDKLESWSFLES